MKVGASSADLKTVAGGNPWRMKMPEIEEPVVIPEYSSTGHVCLKCHDAVLMINNATREMSCPNPACED